METYTLKLSPKHVQIIGDVLASAPYKIVAETLSIIQLQVTAQDSAQTMINEKTNRLVDTTAAAS